MTFSTNLLSCSSIEEISPILSSERAPIIIIDERVSKLYGSLLPYPQIEIKADERGKSLDGVIALVDQLLKLEADRESFLVAIGGGITSDLVAFVASIYFRGVRFALIPTTLLSQVDAAIGGKNGVNFRGYKNLLGTINSPQFVAISKNFLYSLSLKELKEGIAEMAKSFIIGDRESFFNFVEQLKMVKDGSEVDLLHPFALKAAKIKSQIVERDPYERGERKFLNLGHTFAHALERESSLSHGEAVAIGIALAAKLSVKLSLLSSEEEQTILEGLASLGLNYSSPLKITQLIDSIKRDKKRSGERLSFVLIKKIGEVTLYPIEISKLEDTLYDLS